jgi:hypothetical protein
LSRLFTRNWDQRACFESFTRKTLERVPEDKFGWKPHDKSGTMIWLAGHVASIPSYGPVMLTTAFFDIEAGGNRPPNPSPASSKNVLSGVQSQGMLP